MMNTKRIFFFLFLWLPVCTVLAMPSPKIKGHISGIVADKTTGEILEFATISVLDTAKKVMAGTMTNVHGEYRIDNISGGTYIVKASYMGYNDEERTIEITDGNTALQLEKFELSTDSQVLDEVVVTARRATIERQVDKLVVNVANSIMAENNTALEVVRKSPGIAIDKDGNITLNGQAVAVWVDNRPTQLSGQELVALLEGTEGSSIDKIEIIDQPSSKYDASGSGGIVNIKTKKNFLNGFNGSVRTGFTQYFYDNYYFGTNGSVNLNYRNDIISAFLNASTRYSEGFSGISSELSNPVRGFTRKEERHDDDKIANQNVKAGIDFFIDKKNILGVIGNFSLRNYDENGDGHTFEHRRDTTINSFFTGTSRNKYLSATGNMNYTHYFNDSDHELTLNTDYMHYVNTPKQSLSTVYNFVFPAEPDKWVAYTSNAEQFTNIFSGKADYILPINKKMKLEAGGKMSWSTTDNEIVRMDSLAGEWQKNNNLSNDFTYKENIGALYANYAWQITPKWSVKAGLRWEHTYSEGIWNNVGSKTSRNYNDFFPTVFVGYNPTEKHNLSISYTQRIWRPNYWQLNPFRQYMSDYTYAEGNPDLNPQYSHRFNISYTGFQVINAGIMYSLTNDQISQMPIYNVDANGNHITGFRQENFGEISYLGGWIGLSELPVTNWFLFTINLWGAYNRNENYDYTYSSFNGSLYGNLTFVLGKTWTAEVEGWLQSPSSWGYYNMATRGSFDIGIKKTFWDNKASLSIYLDDILNTNKSAFHSDVNGVRQNVTNSWESRSIRAAFTYRFGNMKNGGKYRKNVGQQEDGDRVGSDGK